MLILSWNVNGLRSIHRKNALESLFRIKPDILCLQETRIWGDRFLENQFRRAGYHAFFSHSSRKGYSGVAAYTRTLPTRVSHSLNSRRFDLDGRCVRLDFPSFTLLNVYMPHGRRNGSELPYKLRAYRALRECLKDLSGSNVIIAGDFNIAHGEIDLARPRQNLENIMFTADERRQLDALVSRGLRDSFRLLNEDAIAYTWWPYAYGARARNLGWRIDYIFVSTKLIPHLTKSFVVHRSTGSDHCPVGVEFSF